MRLLTMLTVYLITGSAWAQIYNSSTTSALGGSGRAAVEVGGASFSNPATLVHQTGRQILYSQGQNEFAATISEHTQDILFPAAIGYVQKKLKETGDPVVQDMRLTIAEPITGKFAVGVTAHYYQIRVEEEHHQQGNADVGLIYTPNKNLGLALVSYDVMGGREEIPEAYRLIPRTGLGANYIFRPGMRLRLDALSAPNNNFTDLAWMGGYEVYLNRWIVGRVGYQDDRYNEKSYASVGLGLDLPRFDLNYAYVSELPRNESERHSIDLAIAF